MPRQRVVFFKISEPKEVDDGTIENITVFEVLFPLYIRISKLGRILNLGD